MRVKYETLDPFMKYGEIDNIGSMSGMKKGLKGSKNIKKEKKVSNPKANDPLGIL